MALENIANEDMLFEFAASAGPPDIIGQTPEEGITYTGISTTTSTKVKANAKGVSTTSGLFVFTAVNVCPHTSETHTFVSGGGSLSPGATKTKAEGQLVLRENDTGT